MARSQSAAFQRARPETCGQQVFNPFTYFERDLLQFRAAAAFTIMQLISACAGVALCHTKRIALAPIAFVGAAAAGIIAT